MIKIDCNGLHCGHCEHVSNGFADPPLSTAGEALRATGYTAPTRPNEQGVPA